MQLEITRRRATRRRRLLAIVPGIFMALVLIAGGITALRSPGTYDFPDESVLDGSWTARYEERFEEGLPFRQLAIETWGVIDYVLFGIGGYGVLIGADDWLFSHEEFLFYPEEEAEAAHKLALIKEVHELLKEKDIELVIALLPAKARVYEEKLGRYRLPDYTRDRYANFREALSSQGVIAPDLLTPLLEAKSEEPVFLTTDTHWTPFGAAVTAETLAQAVEASTDFELAREEFETHPQGEPVRHQGDLLNFIPLGALRERIGPEPDVLQPFETVQTRSDPGAALFGDLEIPVILVGTSYSAASEWHFAGALRQALGARVLNVALEGEGPILPMLRYLDDPAFEENPPQLIIWEIPERYLPVAYDLNEPRHHGQKINR